MNNLRFTDNADMALQYAGSIALQFGSYTIDTEHILYGLSKIKDSVASKILANYGITSQALENVFSKVYKNSSTLIASEVDLSIDSKEAILIASQFASQIGHDFVGTEHLLIAILMGENYDAGTIIKRYFRANINDIKNNVLQVLKSKAMGMTSDDSYQYMDMQGTMQNQNISPNGADLPDFMKAMGRDLTAKAREGKIDPIIGRHEEIDRVIEILCRKNKNNPVLIGEAGVGKSAVVDGLALAIANGNVPDLLKNKTIFSLELGGLMAGTKYRGELEERLKQVIDYITNNKDIIVFIDEIHTLVQVGGDKGEVNPADMLKPYLARGEFQTIGATTTEEYRKYIEKDKALERRFQPVIVNPPTVEQTIEILRGLKDSFEVFHKVKISDDAIVAAASLSDRYIMDRSLPDKAIDLIDEASSKVKVNGRKKPDELKELEDEINKYEAEKKEALFAENFEKAGQYRDKIRECQEKIKQISSSNVANSNDLTITQEDICNIISEWTKIPVSKITENERVRLLKLEEILHKRVIGQDEAVEAVSKAIRRARIGLKDNNRPIGSFMFLGQTGVGKTELCKALAEAMFDNENAVIRLDMSEYMEKHSVSKLIGSPPGYVGFDEGGQLTEKVRRKPYSVVLFDEIEKAHPDVFNLLLQVLDDGRLTDSQGRTVSFKNTIIIFTSNVGVSELPKKKGGLGFGTSDEGKKSLEYDEIKEILMNALKRQFKPEFLNRIDVVTVFHPLNYEQLSQIAKLFISNLNKRLNNSPQKANLKVTESALKYLIDKGYDSEYGARPLRRLIEQEIEDKIAEQLLEGNIPNNSTIIISAKDGNLAFKVTPQEN
ncbi:MAG: ATP-dependent Clp protease ATP-binding subunit [Firmicutes bacterium]|nr:ATP-dependent Clp protease ATP-binding subunit [Bacillota bacterium]MDY5676312.1 ATP-dependent Clp protease ATP-binding subunit [Eubacteriales bacterium]